MRNLSRISSHRFLALCEISSVQETTWLAYLAYLARFRWACLALIKTNHHSSHLSQRLLLFVPYSGSSWATLREMRAMRDMPGATD